MQSSIKSPIQQITKTALNFGPSIKIYPEQIFLQTTHSFATVNLKPVAAGHVLVIPKWIDYNQPLISDLSEEQAFDAF